MDDRYRRKFGDREYADQEDLINDLIVVGDTTKITRTWEFRCTPYQENKRRFNDFRAQGELRHAGMKPKPVKLWLPFEMYYEDDGMHKAGEGRTGWDDATTVGRRTLQLAYLLMTSSKIRNIEAYARAWKEEYPDCETTIEILIHSDDKRIYPSQVVQNLNKLMIRLLNDKSINNWTDEVVGKPNEFKPEYNELATKLFQIWKKHNVWIKLKYRPLN